MKSFIKGGIGKVITDYGTKVMDIAKKGNLGRSLFSFIGSLRADSIQFPELPAPGTPATDKGGVIYVKDDGKPYFKSSTTSETDLTQGGGGGGVTLAGQDYLTLSGQEITANSIDLTDDVTGTLPAANGGTGLTSISTLLNSNTTATDVGLGNVTNESKATMFSNPTFTGDVTANGTVDGRDVAADGTKLDGIESGATADKQKQI